jgi:hypothetical protein
MLYITVSFALFSLPFFLQKNFPKEKTEKKKAAKKVWVERIAKRKRNNWRGTL